MSGALGWSAIAAWAAAALLATPAALWLRLREGRRDRGTWILAAFLAVQLVALGVIEVSDPGAPPVGPGTGPPVWLAGMTGLAGLAALAVVHRQESPAGRAAALAFGLYGLGHLLRAIGVAIGASGTAGLLLEALV